MGCSAQIQSCCPADPSEPSARWPRSREWSKEADQTHGRRFFPLCASLKDSRPLEEFRETKGSWRLLTWQAVRKQTPSAAAKLSLTRVQFVESALQMFKFLPSLAELAFRGQALVVGKVFGSFRNEDVEIRCGLLRNGCRRALY